MVKYVSVKNIKLSEREYEPWNMMTFYDCKVVNMSMSEYSAGKRLNIEVEAPRFRKKFYLYAWSDNGVLDAILKDNLKIGDYISCHCELQYYKNKDGRHLEAYRIIPDESLLGIEAESDRVFKLMRIREDNSDENSSKFLSKNDILSMMLG